MASLSKDDKKRAERRALRENRCHNPEEHKEKDSVRSKGKASEDTKKEYQKTIRLFIEYMKEEKDMPEDFQVGQGYPAPSLEELKPFIRFYVNSSKGRLGDKPTVRSTLLFTQRFIPGFYNITRNEIPSNDSRDLYKQVDGIINDIAKEKYNFMVTDFKRTMVVRYRVQFPFLTHEYLCTGAQIGAYTPSAKDKFTKGLHYKDTPIFAGILHLLALALADNAIFGYSSADKIWQQRIPPEAENRCIVRGITATKDSEAAMTKAQFHNDFRRVMNNADYFKTATIHAVRRALGAVVNGFSQFHERGLPCELPAEYLTELKYDPVLIEINHEIEVAKAYGTVEEIQNLKRKRKNE
ncbi:hypothetical protein BDW68DRAFT_192433 [Aspergillus falconensis]